MEQFYNSIFCAGWIRWPNSGGFPLKWSERPSVGRSAPPRHNISGRSADRLALQRSFFASFGIISPERADIQCVPWASGLYCYKFVTVVLSFFLFRSGQNEIVLPFSPTNRLKVIIIAKDEENRPSYAVFVSFKKFQKEQRYFSFGWWENAAVSWWTLSKQDRYEPRREAAATLETISTTKKGWSIVTSPPIDRNESNLTDD